MSGHSKWSSIKHKKAATDAKKGKEFSRVSRLISLAAKRGGDPSMNSALSLAIEKAKAVNMPKTNIEKAIKKGTGELGGEAIEETLYEGYGPEGVAVLVDTASDNKNRTISEVRTTLTKHGGKMASSGAVAYNFERRGQIEIFLKGQKTDQEKIEEVVIDSGAKDFETEKDRLIVYTEPQNLATVKDFFDEKEIKVDSAELAYIPLREVEISDENKAKKIIGLIESLEDLDDVVNVYANPNISENVLEKIV